MDKEYIPREAAIAACFDGFADCRDDCAANIRRIPAADVVEVVRCRECRYSEPYGLDLKCNKHSGSTKNKLGEEIGFIEWHTPHFFCSDGKRKDGGHDE